MIVGYFMVRGRKMTGEETKVKSKLNEPTPPQEGDTINKFGLTTNQTLVDNKVIYLTHTTTNHAPKLGAVYDSLLQEETDKPVAVETKSDQGHKSLEKSQATNPNNTIPPAHHSSRPRDMMVTRTAQPVIVTSSKSKRTKPVHISRKVKNRVEHTPQSPVKVATSNPATSEPVLTFGEPHTEDVESTGVQSHYIVNKSTTVVQQHIMELSLEDVDDNDVQNFSTVTAASSGLSRELLTSSEGK
ncbi:uncharacterized protein [Dysidea avara]